MSKYILNLFTGQFDNVGEGGSGTPGGLNTQVQFNDNGSFGGDSRFTFDKTTGRTALEALEINKVAGFTIEYDNGTKNTDFTIDWNNGNKQKVTIAGMNLAITFINPPGACSLTFKIVQDATGGRTVIFPTTCKWAGGEPPTLSTGANAIDIITFYYDGTNYYGTYSLNFS